MKDTKRPLISIITPTLNSAAFIEDNLRSIQNQSFRNFEHIIVDGGSTDTTLDIVRGIEREAIIDSQKDRGISHAFNRGIRLAKGEVIGILNADDWYDDDVLKDVAESYQDSDFDFILHGDLRKFGLGKDYLLKPRPLQRLFFYFDMPYHHPTVFVPRKTYDQIGFFDEKYTIAMDFDFLLRAKLHGCKFRSLPRVVAHFRLGGIATRNPIDCHREVFVAQTSHGLNFPVCRLAFLAKVTFHHIKRLFPVLENVSER